jgi:hypothetical protein
LELLAAYATILKDKRTKIEFSKSRLVKGLEVLEQAAIEIAALEENIKTMAPELEVTKRDVAATMAQLTIDKGEADAEKEIVAKDEAEAEQQESEASLLKKDAEFELAKSGPLLEEAEKILNELKKDDFYVLNAIKAPTPAVVLGMEISCLMMGVKINKQKI